MIEGIGLPFAYDHFGDQDGEHPQGPPFICFLYDRDDFIADGVNYQPIAALAIELYTDNVDFDLEARVEAALTAAGLPFSMDRAYIRGERMYLTTYNTEVLLTHVE